MFIVTSLIHFLKKNIEVVSDCFHGNQTKQPLNFTVEKKIASDIDVFGIDFLLLYAANLILNIDLPASCKFQNPVTINSKFSLIGLMYHATIFERITDNIGSYYGLSYYMLQTG